MWGDLEHSHTVSEVSLVGSVSSMTTTETVNLLKQLIFQRPSLFSLQLVVQRRHLHDNSLILQVE